VELTPDEALYCLEGIACGFEESWTPGVGDRRSALGADEARSLVRRLAERAGLNPDETLSNFIGE
jgi:hypothetical protein